MPGGQVMGVICRVLGWGGDCVDARDVQYDQVLMANRLVARVWEVGALWCLQAGPLRYSEVGGQLAAWSGLRPSDSAITRALKRLTRGGFVEHTGENEDHRGTYEITRRGRDRIARIAVLIAAVDDHE
jgi:DNA-binding HxlR family transcriptional regulator